MHTSSVALHVRKTPFLETKETDVNPPILLLPGRRYLPYGNTERFRRNQGAQLLVQIRHPTIGKVDTTIITLIEWTVVDLNKNLHSVFS